MEEGSIKQKCFICGKEHSMGPHRYDGHWIKYYKIQVCRDCYLGNYDGWSSEAERRILPHLQENGIEEPERNKNGLLPLEVY